LENKSRICSKCNSEMKRGRLYTVTTDITNLDKLFGYVNWEAVEQTKKYSGLYAYRCEKCGILEFYSE